MKIPDGFYVVEDGLVLPGDYISDTLHDTWRERTIDAVLFVADVREIASEIVIRRHIP